MRITSPCSFRISHLRLRPEAIPQTRPPLIRIENATFYRRQPAQVPTEAEDPSNKPLYPNLTYDFPADNESKEHWSILGPANAGKTTFLELLQSQHLCFPPTGRSYPYLSTEEVLAKDPRLSWPPRAIQYVGFNDRQKGLSGMGTYLSARYESRKETTDFSLRDYLLGRTQLNVEDTMQEAIDQALLQDVVEKLRLGELLDMPTANLSNGQTRRARIAKALLGKPELLLLDEPFIGLDPPTLTQMNPILRELAYNSSPRLLLALRPQDPIPDWITHLMYLGTPLTITHRGAKHDVVKALSTEVRANMLETQRRRKEGDENAKLEDLPRFNNELGRILLDEGIAENPAHLTTRMSREVLKGLDEYSEGSRSSSTLTKLGLDGRRERRDGNWIWRLTPKPPPVGDPLVEMDGVVVRYGERAVLGDWHEQLKMQLASKEVRIDTRTDAYLKRRKKTAIDSTNAGLHWTVRRGERWAIVGPNGSGKTTLLSLITSDHPQAYALPVRLFGRSRLPKVGQPGLSLFDIQSRIGHTSPEVHSFFPRNISVRRTLESAYADTPLSRPRLSATADVRIQACLRWFRGELNPAVGPDPRLQDEMLRFGKASRLPYAAPAMKRIYRNRRSSYVYEMQEEEQRGLAWADLLTFGSLTFSAQRLALFLRAIVTQPDIVVLDEAFSGMDDMLRDKCLLFLSHGETAMHSPYLKNHMFFAETKLGVRPRRPGPIGGEQIAITEGLTANQALIVVTHVKAEIPASVNQFLYLPDRASSAAPGGLRCVTGTARDYRLAHDPLLWQAIWSIPTLPIRSTPRRVKRPANVALTTFLTNSKKELQRSRENLRNWKRQFSRIQRSLADQIPTPAWQRLRIESKARKLREKLAERRQSRMNMDRRLCVTLAARIARLDKSLAYYDVYIPKIKERAKKWPVKIEAAREEQRLREEEGDTFSADFARDWVRKAKREVPLLERQIKKREVVVKEREVVVGKLAIVQARREAMEAGLDVPLEIVKRPRVKDAPAGGGSYVR